MFDFGIIPPAMFLGMVIFMLYGFPVAFSLASVGLFFGVIGIATGHFSEAFLQALPLRVFGIVSNDLLLAIPFFTFMGAILERCGLAEDLLEGTGKLFGGVRWRSRLRRHPRRRCSRRHHRHGRGLGHHHGRDLAADHAALRLQSAACRPASSPPRARSPRSSRPRSCSSFSPTSSADRSGTCISAPSAPSILQVADLRWASSCSCPSSGRGSMPPLPQGGARRVQLGTAG